ncbi:MAG TPA: hypothetical protein V6D29_06720 [Leptolyngbyaceae cyanobacterium]
MTQPNARPQTVPLVGLTCLLIFLIYLFLTTGTQTIHCQQVPSGLVQCESVRTAFFGKIPYATRPLEVKAVDVVSELTDRTPRGGVRFHHTLLLSSEQGTFSADLFQSPLSGAAVKQQVQDFLAGNGPSKLTFQTLRANWAIVRSSLMALLLGIVSWGFWDVRWPRDAHSHSNLPPEEY